MVYRVTALLLALFLGIVVLTRLIGQAQSNPLAVLFTNPDGSPCRIPCLFGVHPDTMNVAEALAVLEKHPLTHMMIEQVVENGTAFESQNLLILIHSYDGRRIDWLMLGRYGSVNPAHPRPSSDPRLETAVDGASLGNVILYLGVPKTIDLSEPANSPTLHTYYTLPVWVTFTTRYAPDLSQVTVNANDALLELIVYPSDQPTLNTGGRLTRWPGFSSLAHYDQLIGER